MFWSVILFLFAPSLSTGIRTPEFINGPCFKSFASFYCNIQIKIVLVLGCNNELRAGNRFATHSRRKCCYLEWQQKNTYLIDQKNTLGRWKFSAGFDFSLTCIFSAFNCCEMLLLRCDALNVCYKLELIKPSEKPKHEIPETFLQVRAQFPSPTLLLTHATEFLFYHIKCDNLLDSLCLGKHFWFCMLVYKMCIKVIAAPIVAILEKAKEIVNIDSCVNTEYCESKQFKNLWTLNTSGSNIKLLILL